MKPNAMIERLPFATKPLIMNGIELEEYIIPEEKKAEVLNDLYFFHPVPGLDDIMEDMHTRKRFAVRQFRVTREGNKNLLVGPFYEDGGGTVIDWIPVRKKRSPKHGSNSKPSGGGKAE
jgi:hypothetical protein